MDEKSRDIDAFYLNDYEKIMNSGIVGFMWRHIHRSLDNPHNKTRGMSVIEVGSGNGQHFILTKLETFKYTEVDIRQSQQNLIDTDKATLLGRRFVIDDANLLAKFEDEQFDLLISSCLLIHLSDMETALKNWKRVVKKGGALSIYVPCDPGVILRIARSLFTRRKIASYGYNQNYIHWKEHRNHYPGMLSLIKIIFAEDEIQLKSFPFKFLPWDFNLYTIVHIKKQF